MWKKEELIGLDRSRGDATPSPVFYKNMIRWELRDGGLQKI